MTYKRNNLEIISVTSVSLQFRKYMDTFYCAKCTVARQHIFLGLVAT